MTRLDYLLIFFILLAIYIDQLGNNLSVLHRFVSYIFQALMELSEVFPAVQAAEKAVELNPTWSLARQTLGRAQLGLGEVDMVR